MQKFFLAIILAHLFFSLASCQTYTQWFGPPFIVQTLPLFNQRTDVVSGTKKSWKGDWIFRRKRLNLVDEEINKKSPNIVFFQELMKKNNKSDSDSIILEYSSLAYHKPFTFSYQKYEETGEEEFAATYVRMGNYSVDADDQYVLEKLKQGGYFVFQKILLDQVPFYLINVKMGDGPVAEGFLELQEKIKKHLDGVKKCYNQILVAGHFKGQTNHPSFIRFLKTFDLVDSAWDFCEMNKNCYTESQSNPILNSSTVENKIYRSERILTHKTSKIDQSEIAFEKEEKTLNNLKKEYHLNTITPSIRYGWQAKISFGICLNKKEKKK